jgi:predicted acetylornithine/succinylornithine family transaminase
MEKSWAERAERVFLRNYYPARVALVRGEGCRVFDDAGKSYLDLVSGIAVNSLGHCHPAVVTAIREQCGTLMHVSNLYQNPVHLRLAELLAEHFPGGRVFFCNSGAEANEAAIKLARRYGRMKSGPQRHVIVSALGSFHGRTMGALTATGQIQYHEGFEPLLPGFRHVPFGDLTALEAAVGEETCAVLLEPIQGESGVIVPPDGYLKGAAEICRRAGALLILDEVQTGMGRTGALFAHQDEGVVPDVMTLSKSLGGGLPLGAMLARGEAADSFEPGHHASTFGGNPVACAAGRAVIETILSENLIERVRSLGAFFTSGLEEIARRRSTLSAVRGRGLLLAAILTVEAAPIVEAALERGYLINAVQKQVLRFAPPFIITEEEIASFLRELEELLG